MGHQETPDTTFDKAGLCFVTDKKGENRGTGRFEVFCEALWICRELVKEHLGEGDQRETNE